MDNKVRETTGIVYCLTCRNEKCVYLSTNKVTSFYDCKSAKPAATFGKFLLRTENWQSCCLVVTVQTNSQERRVATMRKENHPRFWRLFSTNYNQAHTILNQKSLKWNQLWNRRIRFLLADDLSDIFTFQIILFSFNLQSTTTQLTKNHHLLSLQRRNPVDSRFWSRLCYNCSKRARPKFNRQPTRNSPCCLAIAVVSKVRFLG